MASQFRFNCWVECLFYGVAGMVRLAPWMIAAAIVRLRFQVVILVWMATFTVHITVGPLTRMATAGSCLSNRIRPSPTDATRRLTKSRSNTAWCGSVLRIKQSCRSHRSRCLRPVVIDAFKDFMSNGSALHSV